MATFQILRNRHTKTRASVRKSFSEDVFQSVRSLLQSEKELCSVSAEDCGKQDGPVSVTEVTFLGFNEETDAAHIQDLAAVSLELPDLLNSLHFCSLNENEIICMKDINKSSAVSNGPVNKSHHSGMLCVMRVSPTLPRLRIDFIFGLLSKYATGIRYTMDTQLHRKRHREAAGEDGDDTSQSVSSIEDDFVTAFEHLEDEETSKSYTDGANITAPKSQGDAASQKAAAHHLEPHDLRILVSSGRQVLSAKPPTSLINIPGHKEQPVKTSVTTSVSEPWIQRSFYRSSDAPDKGSGTQKTVFSSSPAYSSESECSSPSPVIFLDEEGYQKSLKAKLELPKIPVTKDDIEDSDSEVSEFFDSFDQFDELEQTLETSGPFLEDCVTGKPLQKKGQKHEKSCSAATAMNPQKFKSDRPALPAHVRKPTPRKPESPHLCEAPDSPRPVTASGEDRGLFSPIRSSAFSPLGGSTPVECFCQTNAGGERIHEKHDSVYYTYEDYADSISCEVLGSVLHTQHTDATSNAVSVKKENEAIALKSGSLNQKSKSRTASLMIKDSIQKFAADLVEKSFVGAFKDLQKGVSSCTNALCHLAVRLTTSVFQMAFNELRRQRAFSLQERAIGGLANFLVSEALSNALQDLQYMRKQMLASTAAGFAAGLAEELVFEGVMEVCQLSCPLTPASPPRWPFDSDKDKAVKSYAKDLSESVIQEAFIELSQVDVTFAAKAAVSVSTDNVKCVSAENLVPSTETPTFPPAFNNQAVTATRPAQDCEKEYTVQQALFCTSGIVTSIPMPLAGSALLPYHFSANACQAKSHLSSGDGNLSGGSAEAHVSTKNEEEGACLRNICLSSEHNPGNHSDLKPADDVVEVQSSSKLTSNPVIISNFSAAMVHTIVNETLESVTSFKDTKTAGEHTDCLTRTVKGKTPFHHDQVTLQQSEASRKDMFADQLSKSIIKHSIDKSKSVTLNIDKHVEHKEGLPVPGEASQRSTLEKCPKFPDAQGHLNHCSLSAGRDGVPECRGSAAHGFSLGTPPRCTAAAGQRPDLKEAAKDKSVKKNNLSNTTPEPLSFGQESPFPHSQSFSSTVLTCVDGLHVEDKQKIRDGNVMPDTPPSTPLVPSRASSECDIKKLTTKLKGELAKDFAPATPPSTPHNSSGGSLSENEQNAIEKEEFMLKLMRSLSEEVESGDGEGRAEVDVKSEHSGKKAQFAEALATRIVSLATEVAASHLDNSIIQEPRVKSPCLNVQSQRSVSPTFLNHSGEDLQTLRNFAGDMAAEVVTEAEHIAKVTSRLLFKQRRSSCYVEGGQDDRSEKSHVEAAAHPREDLFILSLPSSRMSGLTYKYPSCESVTDEYAGHIIQILKQEGGDSELLVDQFANRLAYRSVKSGLQEAARTARVERSSQTPLAQSSGAETSSALSVFLQKEHHQGAGKKRQRKRSGGHACKPQTCARARDTCRGECSELDGFSTSLARSIARDARRALTAPAGGRPQPAAGSCCREQSGRPAGAEPPAEPAFPEPLQPSLQSHGFYHRTGGVSGRGCGESVIPAVDQGAGEVPGDTLELSPGPAGVCASERAKAAGGTACAPPAGQACRRCDHRDRHDRGGSSAQHLFRQHARSEPLSDSKLGHVCQKPRIFHLDVPHVHVDLDKKTVLAEKIVAEAIERAERELSAASVAAGSGSGQEGVGFAESLTSEITASAMAGVGRALSSPKEIEDFQSAESLGSQQMNLSVGDDSTGSWSNLSFEDEHQDESSSFHHLSESNGNSSSWSSLALEGDLCEDSFSFPASDSDGPDDKDEEHEDEIEGLEQDGKTLLITNIDMEPCTVDPQLRVILQWLVASEVEVAQLAFHDSAKKEFVRLSKRLQEKGWKVGDLLQAVLKYYDVTEKTHSEDKCKSLFDWLLENA